MFKFDVEWLNKILNDSKKEINKWLKKGIKDSLVVLNKEIIKLSPVDSWDFIKWNKVGTIIKNKDKITWKVYNKMKYASKVEKGFRKSAVNRHKSWKRIYTGRWNKTYERTLINKQKQIEKIIEKNIKI